MGELANILKTIITMNLHHQALKVKSICKTKQGNDLIIELCRVLEDIHKKGKHVGYDTAIKEVELRVQNALDMKDQYIN